KTAKNVHRFDAFRALREGDHLPQHLPPVGAHLACAEPCLDGLERGAIDPRRQVTRGIKGGNGRSIHSSPPPPPPCPSPTAPRWTRPQARPVWPPHAARLAVLPPGHHPHMIGGRPGATTLGCASPGRRPRLPLPPTLLRRSGTACVVFHMSIRPELLF